MEQIMTWATVIGIIVIPVFGVFYKLAIQKNIDDMNAATERTNKRVDVLESQMEKKEKMAYDAINGQRNAFDHCLTDYVRKDMYTQAIELHRINNDEKFKSLLSIVTTQYSNLESKINESNINMNEKINSLKNLINEKFKD